jgi:hypothetical protein
VLQALSLALEYVCAHPSGLVLLACEAHVYTLVGCLQKLVPIELPEDEKELLQKTLACDKCVFDILLAVLKCADPVLHFT